MTDDGARGFPMYTPVMHRPRPACVIRFRLGHLGDTGQRYATHRLNREDGSGHAYTIPRGDPDIPQHLCLPTEFFTTGWHLVLTPSELATFLAVCHAADRKLPRVADGQTPRRIYLTESLRRDNLGLSDEAYLSIHQLAEFGLIETDDTVEGRRRGRIPPKLTGGKRPDPYQLTPPSSADSPPTKGFSTSTSSNNQHSKSRSTASTRR